MKLRIPNPLHWITSLASGTGMPLLGKELTEQAARKRTYVLRMVYAVLLFTMSGFFLASTLDSMQRYGFGPFSILGRGREMLGTLLAFQFVGIYLFLPAMVSSVITHEKERNSLTLLMLTDLRPWEIILQKLISRLIPMLTFVMLSMPLMALAYAFGGIEASDVVSAVFVVFLACLQVSACAIMCSAFARSTAGAFLMTYVILVLLYFTMPVLGHMVDRRPDEFLIWCLTPPFIFGYGIILQNASFGKIVAYCIPIMVTITLFLVLARVFLVRRAMLPPRNWWLGVFRWMDSKFNNINKSFGNITLFKDRNELPGDHPVAWREITKKALAKPAYLIRILVLLELPLLLLVTVMVSLGDHRYGDAEELSAALFILWPIAALMFCVQGANLFVVERSRQTLDVLLTTPLSSKEILAQKMASLRRLWMILAIPFGTIILVEAWFEYERAYYGYASHGSGFFGGKRNLGLFGYLSFGALSVLVYLPMIAWFSAMIGMRMKSQSRAIMAAAGGFVAWCLGPMIFFAMFEMYTRSSIRDGWGIAMALSSPMTIVPFAEFDDVHRLGMHPTTLVYLNFAWYGCLTFAMRAWCFANADRWLGRVPEPAYRV